MPVGLLVAGEHPLADVGQLPGGEDPGGHLGVAPYLIPLRGRQRTRLAEDRVGDPHLADVVQHAGEPQPAHPLLREPHLVADHLAVAGHDRRVIRVALVAQVEDLGEAEDRAELGPALLGARHALALDRALEVVAVDDDPVGAQGDRRVGGRRRRLQELVDVARVLREDRHADAGAEVESALAIGAPHPGQDLLGEQEAGVLVRLREHDHELRRPGPADGVDPPGRLVEHAGELPQDLVPGLVAEVLVELPQPAQVDRDQADAMGVDPGPLDLVREDLVDPVAVHEAGQQIGAGSVAQRAPEPVDAGAQGVDHEAGDREAAERDDELERQRPRARFDAPVGRRHQQHHGPVADAEEGDVDDRVDPGQEVEGVEARPEVEEAERGGRIVGEVDAGGDLQDAHGRGHPDEPHRDVVGEDQEGRRRTGRWRPARAASPGR